MRNTFVRKTFGGATPELRGVTPSLTPIFRRCRGGFQQNYRAHPRRKSNYLSSASLEPLKSNQNQRITPSTVIVILKLASSKNQRDTIIRMLNHYIIQAKRIEVSRFIRENPLFNPIKVVIIKGYIIYNPI